MGASFEPLQLRPLGVGEIFDRAVTIYVRNIVLFTIIAAFVVVPLSIAQYFMAVQRDGSWAQILAQIQHPSTAGPNQAMPFTPALAAFVGISLVITPFMYVAAAWSLGRIYDGTVPDWRSAYSAGLSRAGSILLTVLFEFVVLIALLFCGMIAFGLALVASFLLVRAYPPLGIAAIAISFALLAVLFVGAMLCYLALAITFDAIGIEGATFGRAIARSFARVFNRAEIGKAILVCLAFLAVQVALLIVVTVVDAAAVFLVRSPAVETLFQALFSLVTTGFIAVLVAVYYFDVRIRREGLDLQSAIDRLQPQPQPHA